jgi:membrane protease YdiL (CAAX protease family)
VTVSSSTDALARTLAIWWLLAVAGVASRAVGSSATLLAQLAAVAIAVVRPASGSGAAAARALARGLGAGWVGYPAWQAAIVCLGVAAGLSPLEPPGREVDIETALQRCLLAPVWEELLYRGRVLPALRPRLGPVAAVAVSSLAFALPHARPWALLGSFVVGCGLGVVRLRSRSPWTGVGIHAGFNGAARLWSGEPVGPMALLASGLGFLLWLRLPPSGGRPHEPL